MANDRRLLILHRLKNPRAHFRRAKRIRQWPFYRRDERRISDVKKALQSAR